MHNSVVGRIPQQSLNCLQIFGEGDDVLQILEALHTAPIVSVDVHDVGAYESGTSEKWVVTLLGGQKTMMKLIWLVCPIQ